MSPPSSPRRGSEVAGCVLRHTARQSVSSSLSPELREKYGVRSISLRVGDTVRVLRGDYAGAEGKVTRLDRTSARILVEGITREKVDGTSIPFPIHASKVQVTRLNLDDKWRRESLE